MAERRLSYEEAMQLEEPKKPKRLSFEEAMGVSEEEAAPARQERRLSFEEAMGVQTEPPPQPAPPAPSPPAPTTPPAVQTAQPVAVSAPQPSEFQQKADEAYRRILRDNQRRVQATQPIRNDLLSQAVQRFREDPSQPPHVHYEALEREQRWAQADQAPPPPSFEQQVEAALPQISPEQIAQARQQRAEAGFPELPDEQIRQRLAERQVNPSGVLREPEPVDRGVGGIVTDLRAGLGNTLRAEVPARMASLMGFEDTADRYRRQAQLRRSLDPDMPDEDSAAYWWGSILGEVLPAFAGPGAMLHFTTQAAGSGREQVRRFEEQTGQEVGPIKEGLATVGYGAAALLLERLGLAGISRISDDVAARIGSRVLAGDGAGVVRQLADAGIDVGYGLAKGAGVEATQETAEQVANNITDMVYDRPEDFRAFLNEATEGTFESAQGGGAGGLILTAFSMLSPQARRQLRQAAQMRAQTQDTPQPSQPEPPTPEQQEFLRRRIQETQQTPHEVQATPEDTDELTRQLMARGYTQEQIAQMTPQDVEAALQDQVPTTPQEEGVAQDAPSRQEDVFVQPERPEGREAARAEDRPEGADEQAQGQPEEAVAREEAPPAVEAPPATEAEPVPSAPETRPEPEAGARQQQQARREPWRLTRTEWERARENLRFDDSGSGPSATRSRAEANIAKLEELLYGVRDDARRQIQRAQAGEIDLSPDEAEALLERINTRVTHRDVVEKALREGQPVPPEVLAEYPDLAQQYTQQQEPPRAQQEQEARADDAGRVQEPAVPQESRDPQEGRVRVPPRGQGEEGQVEQPQAQPSEPTPQAFTRAQLEAMKAKELDQLMREQNIPRRGVRRKAQMVERILEHQQQQPEPEAPQDVEATEADAATTPQETPRLSDQLIQRLDRIEAEARQEAQQAMERLRDPNVLYGGVPIPPGTGQLIRAAAKIAAARMAKSGVRAGQAVADALRGMGIDASRVRPEILERIARAASRILRDAGGRNNVTEESFERAVAAFDQRQATRRGSTKARVREATGQRQPNERRLTERQALRASMTAQQRAARQAARETARAERQKAKAELERMRQEMRAGREAAEAVRQRFTSMVVDHLPKSVRGEFVQAVRDVDTPKKLLSGIRRVQRALQRHEHRLARRRLERALSKIKPKYMRPEFRKRLEGITGEIDLRKMTPKTKRTLESLAAHLQKEPDALIPEYVRQQLKRLDRTPLESLSVEQIDALTEAVKRFNHQNRLKNRLLAGQRHRNLQKTAVSIAAEVKQRPPLNRKNLPAAVKRVLGRKLSATDIRRPEPGAIRRYFREGATPFAMLTEELSPTLHEVLYQRMSEARNVELSFRHEAQDRVREVMAEHNLEIGTRAFENWRQALRPVETQDGSIELSHGEAAELLAHSRDPETLEQILDHGYTLERTGETVRFTREQLAELPSRLSAPEVALAEAIQNLYNTTYRQRMNEAWVEVHGHEIARRESYYPRVRDRMQQQTGKDPQDLLGNFGQMTLESQGIVQERTGASSPVMGRDIMETFVRHTDAAGRIVAYLAPVRDANMVLGHPTVKQAIASRYGEPMLQTLAGRVHEQAVGLGSFDEADVIGRKLMGRAAVGILGLRLSTAAIQPAGLFIAAAHSKARLSDLVKAPLSLKDWRSINAIARRHSPQWRERYENFFHALTSGIVGERRASFGPKPWTQLMLLHIEKTDKLGAVIRWRMAEAEVQQDRPDLTPGTDAYHAEVARVWERLVNRSENTSAPIEHSGLIAAGKRNPWLGFFVMFQSAPSKIYGTMREASRDLANGNVREGTWKLAMTAGSAMYVAAVRRWYWGAMGAAIALATGGEPEDDERSMGYATLKELLGTLPILGDAFNSLVNYAETGRTFASRGTPFEQASEAATGAVASFVKMVDAALNEELDAQGKPVAPERFVDMLEGLARAAGLWWGFPPTTIADISRQVRKQQGSSDAFARARQAAQRIDEAPDLTQDRRRVWRAVQENDGEGFAQAVQAVRRKNPEWGPSDVLSTVKSRYGFLSRFEEPENIDKLDEEEKHLIDTLLQQRQDMIEQAHRLIAHHRSAFSRRQVDGYLGRELYALTGPDPDEEDLAEAYAALSAHGVDTSEAMRLLVAYWRERGWDVGSEALRDRLRRFVVRMRETEQEQQTEAAPQR